MNSPTIFDFQDGPVRVSIDDKGDPWFAATDVCRILGIANSPDAVSRLREDEKRVSVLTTPGGPQNLSLINEPALYKLIFKSRKKSAESFQTWVTSEVLPAIRKTGSFTFGNTPSTDIPQSYAQALLEAGRLALELENKSALIESMTPKVEFADAVMRSEDVMSMSDVAKILAIPGMGTNQLFAFLRNNPPSSPFLLSYGDSWNCPADGYVKKGFAKSVETPYSQTAPNGKMVSRISIKTVITQRGLDFIRGLLKRNGVEGAGT